ncbi:MAG TPA: sigma-70 family RNA polymerase sigma factor, partial [Polyangiaceae bacterium]|nr:sigma-70 family RNA polymerase sigma factor [Polyangiaceae bacterium]
DEGEIARRWLRENDLAAAETLIRANLRYVVAIALTYRRYGLPLADLIAEGNFGLVHAVGKFNPERGTRFVTYAAYWVRAYMLNYVIRSWSMVGVGSGPLRSKLFFRLRRERARIANLVGDNEEAAKMLAERFGESQEKIMSLANRLEARDVSLDARLFDDGSVAILDTLESDAPSQEETVANSQSRDIIKENLHAALTELDPRERFIVEVRMMADSDEALSLAEIGRRLGVSRERARQLEARAKRKLRERLAPLRELQSAA